MCCGKTVEKVTHGAIGLAKAALGMGLAPSEVIEARRSICATCDQRRDGIVLTCSVCDCVIQAKTMLLEENCPVSKWGKP